MLWPSAQRHLEVSSPIPVFPPVITIFFLESILIIYVQINMQKVNPFSGIISLIPFAPFCSAAAFIIRFNRSYDHLRIINIVMKLLILFLAFCAVIATSNDSTDKLWPKPQSFSHDPQGERVVVSPCHISYITNPDQKQVNQMLQWYLTEVFKCSLIRPLGEVWLNITVSQTAVLIASDVNHEAYELDLFNKNTWRLYADYYPGFLRGLETLSQLFEKNQNDQYEIVGLPIAIKDVPDFKWRGLMIDTSRHYLPVTTIKRAIDSMLYSKLNVLHWHIIDEDSFPMEVPNVPELSEFGSVGGVFSEQDIKSVIEYARIRGIRVIPEIDTPAHTQSWGRSEKYKDITLICNGIYMGQFDPTLDLTWQLVTEVMNYVNSTFEDDYVHFGGDEVVYDCWGDRPSILEWMQAHNISDYFGLSVYYRQRQKGVWRGISPSKKVIYWANEEIDLPMEDEDVIDWWGVSSNVNRMAGRKNEVIMSNYDLTYLDIGFNNFYGNVYGSYQDWRKMYSYEPRVESVNVIGGESCMWNELGNLHTFDQKVVQRSSVLAERLWNVEIDINTELNNIATRLTAHAARLRERGFKIWPVTVGLCEQDMSICF